jgi:hypothetical protein
LFVQGEDNERRTEDEFWKYSKGCENTRYKYKDENREMENAQSRGVVVRETKEKGS